MARPVKIEETAVLQRLTEVFRDVGYDGASLALLAEGTGLQKASLYHRFPGGKEQMAGEVMTRAEAWLQANVLAPLRTAAPPADRIAAMVRALDDFYDGGRRPCLLNMLSSPTATPGPLAPRIKHAFNAWIAALAGVLRDAALDRATARARAERAVALIQGSLVVARGIGSPKPFRTQLAALQSELLAPPPGDPAAL